MNDLTESNSEMNDPQSIKMYQDLPEIVVTNGGIVKNGIEEDEKTGKMYCKITYNFRPLFSNLFISLIYSVIFSRNRIKEAIYKHEKTEYVSSIEKKG